MASGPRSAKCEGEVRQLIGNFVRLMLNATLAMAVLLASNARIASHDLADLEQIVAEHQNEIADFAYINGSKFDLLHK